MDTIGLDLHKRESQLSIIGSGGEERKRLEPPGAKLNTAPCGVPTEIPPCGHQVLSIRSPGSVAPSSRKRSSIVKRPVTWSKSEK
jgi:hypothetical protein